MARPTLASVAEALRKRGFDVICCADVQAARDAVVRLVEESGAKSIGFGGSQSVRVLNLADTLRERGCVLHDHNAPGLSREQVLETRRAQLSCDLFLLSANAVTEGGVLVNIDGVGNRVAASVFGPRRVLWVIGRNKLVAGGPAEGLARARAVACPQNARRLQRRTPCATGVCTDCASPDRICAAVSVLEHRPSCTPTTILLVDADLGY